MKAVRQIHEHPTWRKHRPLVPLPASLVKAQRDLGLPHTGFPSHFTLQRSKEGTIVMLWFRNRIGINVTPDEPLPTFKAARRWCAGYARQYGFEHREAKP